MLSAMNIYWLCLALSVCFRFSLAQNDQSLVEFLNNFDLTEVKEREITFPSLEEKRRNNILEREQSFSRISRPVSEEPKTDHNLETHTTEEPLTDDRKNFLLKFFQQNKDKFELENV
jgi:hypothetical protein